MLNYRRAEVESLIPEFLKISYYIDSFLLNALIEKQTNLFSKRIYNEKDPKCYK